MAGWLEELASCSGNSPFSAPGRPCWTVAGTFCQSSDRKVSRDIVVRHRDVGKVCRDESRDPRRCDWLAASVVVHWEVKWAREEASCCCSLPSRADFAVGSRVPREVAFILAVRCCYGCVVFWGMGADVPPSLGGVRGGEGAEERRRAVWGW